MAVELELKYAAADAACLACVECDAALRAVQAGPARIIEMESRYFDTVDGALSARLWTLRLRRENGRVVATCKTAGTRENGVTARGEWECEAADIVTAIPALIENGAPAVLAALTAQGLMEVCGAAFIRRAVLLRFPDGSEAETVFDLGRLTGGGQSRALCEMELERKHGAPDAMLQFGAALAARHGLRPEEKSKFARALELAHNE